MATDEKVKASPLVVRDTRDLSRKGSFDNFREAVVNPAVPWSLEPRCELEFAARVESVEFEKGFFRRVQALPHAATRTPRHLGNSTAEGYLALFMLSGRLVVEQDGESKVAEQGDLIVFDTTKTSKMSYQNQLESHQSLAFFAPKSGFVKSATANLNSSSCVVEREQLIYPLSACLSLVSSKLYTATGDELYALFNACMSLLPVASSRFEGPVERRSGLHRDVLFAEILNYLDRELANTDLSPPYVARKFAISDRYLHKLFAFTGTTFSSYLTARRLEHVAADLVSPAGRREPIAALAYRWAFGDISSFNRSFKERFGCTPRAFRRRSGLY